MSESTTSQAERPDAELPEVDGAQADLPGAGVAEADVSHPSEVPGSDVPVAAGGIAVPASPSATTVEEPLEAVQAAGDAASDGDTGQNGDDLDRLENEGDIAADYLEELLDIADLDGDLDMDVEGDRAAVSIVGGDVRLLVGRDGEVLEALQELTRLAVYRETGERSRLMLDVGGFRADKRSRLERVAADAVAEVKSSGERKALDAMTPFERKVVHDVVAAAGLSSASEGQEPRRYVVVLP